MTAKLRDRLFLVGAGVLLVASLAIGSWMGYGYWQDSQAEQAREDSVAVARRAVEGMFGYNFKTIDTDMAKVSEDMSDDFKQDWNKVTETVLVPGAKEQELVVKATIVGSGVIKTEADEAEVMIFINQQTTGKDPAAGTYDASRLRVKLERPDDRWLVSDVDPI
ncbi:h domain protein [Nocardia cyriacigeorgica]|uniref:H domain protein n=1 Tax=Nocardia cyriacigeorgica TaxID=135487 RepID=A0A6P1D6G1_9NOCA|nr:h domain protein [Nocardia cyriacigeorgica]NEW38784.1 h domain protein [Nocardia cyriacigeorgica]NEW44433.1 h domain protein [Nocardia cyriacigeorgica]NEW52817.1 h domain protein [Nocardia cyriacigeorgica]NEW56827.1 h domain protein [Nocardia cyriacigeorgica]